MPKDLSIKKVLVIGSGPIVIGQAAEFDYAGAQACRVLKSEGVEAVLVNCNPATIMTDFSMANEIYLEPLNTETIKRIILKEKPDSLLAGLGGQTGLTIAMQLYKEGFLQKHNIRLIGTNAEAIIRAEDRQRFKDTMDEINQPCIPSDTTHDVEEAVEIANRIGYPVIIRPAFTLGGAGGGVAYNEEQLRTTAGTGLSMSPIHQILVEKYIFGYKEVEFEVMRDGAGNVITVCSMENVDPVGVHTGDSIVVAPAATLSDKEYSMLRKAALDIITELKIEGGCNCQFALDPYSDDYFVIEVNPRVSRSSALASKATGYPIAKVTSKIALGYTLDEIQNDVTGITCACFEPTVDYVVLKMPKWPFDKFPYASRKLGTQMKATGEVMAIGDSFEAALMKAVRGAELSLDTLHAPMLDDCEDIKKKLADIDDVRIFAVYEALRRGVSVDEINEITRIDKFFINKIKKLAEYENKISNNALDAESYKEGKRLGYTDKAIERISGGKCPDKLFPVYKTVDTCAGEFDAKTPYFYSVYGKACEARPKAETGREKIIVLGSGPIRIGQGIEFDYSSVHCAKTLRELGYEVIIINNNPETVSTDFDVSDRLYFEPLSPEDVMGVIEVEKPIGVVVAFGGQTAIKLVKFLNDSGIRILGTSAEGIDLAEDREKFDALLNSLDIKRPRGLGIMTMEEALDAAHTLKYPVLLRPSYVIGGQNMTIAYTDEDVKQYMELILSHDIENPVLVDKYMSGTELEVDVISDGEDVLIPGIMEHIERAGVHSGDSIAIYPPQNISDKLIHRIIECSTLLSKSLGTKGLVNIQYLTYEGELYVIEVNPRASRTIPYISKVTGIPMVDIASRVMLGAKLKDLGYESGLYKIPPYVAVKVPVFSFEKLSDVNSSLGPEMKSTGEVLGVGKNLTEALFKGMVSAGFRMDLGKGDGVYITVGDNDKFEIVKLAKKFADLGLNIYATKGTAKAISALGGIEVGVVQEGDGKTLLESATSLVDNEKIKLIVYTGAKTKQAQEDYISLHRTALLAGVACITSLDTANALADIVASRFNLHNTELVDINHMRTERKKLSFTKMQACGNDYLFFDNSKGEITCPESLALSVCDRNYGVGADGIVLIEKSRIADAKIRIFNKDGSEGKMAGNSVRCVTKYLYDNGITDKEELDIETASGIKHQKLYIYSGLVRSVSGDMGEVSLNPADLPTTLEGDEIINKSVKVGGEEYNITCVSVGNPHCVIFCDSVDKMDVEAVGTMFENCEFFPERVNTEFVRVVNKNTLKMRVWERGNGETLSCGTGACAAAVAAVVNGYCEEGADITVKLRGGDLIVNYKDGKVTLTGSVESVFDGTIMM